MGNVTQITDADGQIQQFHYDKLDRLKEEDGYDATNAHLQTKKIEYTRDWLGRLLSTDTTDYTGNGAVITHDMDYAYDALGRVTDYKDGITEQINKYDGNSNRFELDVNRNSGSGNYSIPDSQTLYTYNQQNDLVFQAFVRPGLIAGVGFGRNLRGQITSQLAHNYGPFAPLMSTMEQYVYYGHDCPAIVVQDFIVNFG